MDTIEENRSDNLESNLELEHRIFRLKFWLFIVISLLLIITFIFYLPLQFKTSSEENEHIETSSIHLINVAYADAGHADEPLAHGEGGAPPRVALASVSLVLMALLSWGVYKYITVKA